MKIIEMPIEKLQDYSNNPRHNEAAIGKVAASIEAFGFKVPIVIDKDNVIIAGHTRRKAAERLGMQTVPCIIADDLTEEQVKAFRLADNKTSEFAEWDFEKLNEELAELHDIDFDMSAFGFEIKAEEEFDETDLDEEVKKENVIVSINCNNVNDYESIKERLQNLADEVNATLAVKMA